MQCVAIVYSGREKIRCGKKAVWILVEERKAHDGLIQYELHLCEECCKYIRRHIKKSLIRELEDDSTG